MRYKNDGLGQLRLNVRKPVLYLLADQGINGSSAEKGSSRDQTFGQGPPAFSAVAFGKTGLR